MKCSRLLSTLWSLVPVAQATYLPLHTGPVARGVDSLRRRYIGNATGGLTNVQDMGYYTNITLGGDAYSVLIDTGSSDLWVAGLVNNTLDANTTLTIASSAGYAQGSIKAAGIVFQGIMFNEQAFVEVTNYVEHLQGTGVMGLGLQSSSLILAAQDTFFDGFQINATPTLYKIFAELNTEYITLMLGRTEGKINTPSSLTIGEVLSGYSPINDQPILAVEFANNSFQQSFAIPLDKQGFVGPKGHQYTVTSNVTNSSSAIVILSSGAQTSIVPPSIASLIYSNIHGAYEGSGEWMVPCSAEINITFLFSGHAIPIHPLDVSMPVDGVPGLCIGTFQSLMLNSSDVLPGNYDMILGMNFLRNVYSLYNYGYNASGATNDPYVQLLSITNANQAHLDFVNVRLGGVDNVTEINALGTIQSGSQGFSHHSYTGAIVGACVGGTALVALLLASYRYRDIILARYRGRKARHQGGVIDGPYQDLDGADGKNPLRIPSRRGHVRQESDVFSLATLSNR